ncbi:MAG TPA: SLC13 family permease [Woeseiaceae bacterium]|nr:SLC13 family permease [Woeseiaceae bacterium]
MSEQNNNYRRLTHQRVGLWLGPLVAIAMLFAAPPETLSQAGWNTAAMGLLMAVWWATEAVPIAVTALLPLVFFPLLGISDINATAAPFANKVIYLFLGGFIIALAMQRWNLHHRIALGVLQHAGRNGRTLVGGFMVACALLSMWVSNTSTTLMMLPIALSVIEVMHRSVPGQTEKAQNDFRLALLLGVAYAASIGGLATLVGSPPNAMMAAFMRESYAIEVDFAHWLLVGLPLTMVLLPLTWLLLTRLLFRVDFTTSDEGRGLLRQMKDDLGAISRPEKRVAAIFLTVAMTWMLRPLLARLPGLDLLDDAGIAMAGAVALFLVPSGDREDPMLLRWRHVEKLPWNILILFGGGLALASAVADTGLAGWLGTNLQAFASLPVPLLVLIVTAMIIFLTELTSNTATAATFLPVVGAVAIEAGVDPLVLVVPVTLAASCAFMLPVATPPNAIVFASGALTIPQMARAGLLLNLIAVISITLLALAIAPLLEGT